MQPQRFISIAIILLLASSIISAEEPSLVFETHIEPILSEKCGKCHGKNVRKAGLDLSAIAGVRRGGESGDPAVSDTLDTSPLWTMIHDGEMPPKDEPQLTKVEIDRIRKWISTGAAARDPGEPIAKTISQHDVLPVLLLRCATCHGPRRQDGGLDLHTIAGLKKGGESGPAMLVGDPDASLMIRRIESEACPPRASLLKFFVRRPSTAEVETLRNWIAAGAPVKEIAPDVATNEPDPLVTDEDRQHWAFQPPRLPKQKNSVDDFVSPKLNEVGLKLSPEAARDTLIRRAYIDLIGMPPSIDEWKKWHNHRAENWYSQMIDHLLASPHYGERWGRYWLDVAGYADSEGGVSSDPIRKVAWKYRDYVVRSINDDKPYDRFLLEQIAGDELIDYENAKVVTDEMVDNLIATGFLRMGIDQTGSRTMNFVPERLGVIGDAIGILGSGVMGLTLECAKCHSHKYDPIPHRDYYRFKAIFQGAYDEHDWLTFKKRSLNVATPKHRQRVADKNPPLAAKLKKLDAGLKSAMLSMRLETLRQHYPAQSEADRVATLQALRIADNNRSQTQRILVEKLQQAEVIPDSQQPDSVLEARSIVKKIEGSIDRIRKQLEPPLAIRALWDRGEPSPTYVLRRGEHAKPGRLVGPGVPSVLTDGQTPFRIESPFPGKTGRRLAFARWLTHAEHPLTARVMVNRIWFHHFGTGIVKTLENFGVKGERPSHPELLDWLAIEFVREGWSIKELHRVIMNSRTYRQTNRISVEHQKRDPQNQLLSRMPLRRMDAEAIRDSLLFVSGKLDVTPGGQPDIVSVNRDGLVSIMASPKGSWRRSIYVQYRRTEIPTMMDTFDYPEMGPNCVARNVSTVSPQSLLLMNNQHVRKLATAFAERVIQMAGEDLDKQITITYQLALSRSPSERERQLSTTTLDELRSIWKDQTRALESYCHTIMNSAAFIYVD